MAFWDTINWEDHESKLDWIRKYQKWVYVVGVLLLALQLFFVLVSPKLDRMALEERVLARQETVLAESRAKVLDKAKLKLELDRLQDALHYQERVFFSEAEYNEFSIHTIFSLVDQYGGRVSKVKFGTPKMKGDVAGKNALFFYPLQVNMTSDFVGLMQLLNLIEHYPKQVRISTFSMNRRSVDPVVLSVNLGLDVYVLRAASPKKGGRQ